LINSSEAALQRNTVLRQAQHERIILNPIEVPSVHPEPVEGRTEGFSTASKKKLDKMCGTSGYYRRFSWRMENFNIGIYGLFGGSKLTS
jgi:hypothetical protein